MVKNPLESLLQFYSWVRKIHWSSDRLPIPIFLGFPCGSAGKESTCNVGDLGPIPGLGRPPREGKVYPLQYSGLEHSLDCIVHEVTKSQTRQSNFHFHHTLFYTVALFCGLNSWRLISPAPFFLKNTLAIWALLCVHTNFKKEIVS